MKIIHCLFAMSVLMFASIGDAQAQCAPDTLLATIPNPAPAEDELFGASVVVGAYWDDPGGVNDAGTAYVFNATTGALVATP